MRCHGAIHNVTEFRRLGDHLNYPLQLTVVGKKPVRLATEREVLALLENLFREGPVPVHVLDHEEDDPL